MPAALKQKSVVLGAGVTGLAVAWKLAEAGRNVEVVEIDNQIGGSARTFRWGEFLIDTGPHKFYTTLGGILDSVKDLLKDELITVPKKTSIYLQGRFIDYPFRLTQLLTALSPVFGVKLGLSYIGALLKERNRPDLSYEDWIVKRFGWALYQAAFQGLAEKIWSHPKELSSDLARRRIVTPGMMVLLKRVLLGHADKQAPAPNFHYPRMGISRLSDKMMEKICSAGSAISLKHTVEKINCRGGRVTSVRIAGNGGSREEAVHEFVSTIPIARMLELLSPTPPENVLEAARQLQMKPIMLGFIAFKTPRLLRDVWIFFPDKKYIFNRISEQKGFSSAMGPADKTVVCFDITAGHMPEAWNWPRQKVLKKCLDDLADCGLYHGELVIDQELFKIPNIYPVYDLEYQRNLRQCLDFLQTIPNLYTIGRSGLFCYNNTDQCLDMGYRLAEHIVRDGGPEDMKRLLAYFDGYEIVD